MNSTQRKVDQETFERVYADYKAGKYHNIEQAALECGVKRSTFGRLKLRYEHGLPLYDDRETVNSHTRQMTEESFKPVYDKWHAGEINTTQAATMLNMDTRRWSYWRDKYERGIPFTQSVKHNPITVLPQAQKRTAPIDMSLWLYVYNRWKTKRISGTLAARELGIRYDTFKMWAERFEHGISLNKYFEQQFKNAKTRSTPKSDRYPLQHQYDYPSRKKTVPTQDDPANLHVREKHADWLHEKREKMGLTLRQMAKLCKCSVGLLEMVEDGAITHPHIASRIAARYNLSVDEYNDLIFDQYRRKTLPKPIMPPRTCMWSDVIYRKTPEEVE